MLITRFYDIFSGDKSHFALSFPSPESIPAEGFPAPPPGMCAILPKDVRHPGQRWRTSRPETEPILSGDIHSDNHSCRKKPPLSKKCVIFVVIFNSKSLI